MLNVMKKKGIITIGLIIIFSFFISFLLTEVIGNNPEEEFDIAGILGIIISILIISVLWNIPKKK